VNLPIISAFAIIIGMMALFAWGRWRYDLVAVVALFAAIAVGIVPPDKAFSGFSDDIVIIVASALLVSGAVARSGAIERVVRKLAPHLVTINQQVLALVVAVTVLSAFLKNIGALAMLMPIAFSTRPTHRNIVLFLADAHVFRCIARGHHDASRHVAEHHCIAHARSAPGATLRHV
jgi:Na+/H+ antiporter NhaD/arsenite permease-like protein